MNGATKLLAAHSAATLAAPDDFAGLDLWLAADNLTGLAHNDPIGTWADTSAGDDAVSSGSVHPTYQTNQVNGLPAVLFDSASERVNTGATAIHATDQVAFAVVRSNDTTDPQTIISGQVSGSLQLRWNTATVELIHSFTAAIGTPSHTLSTSAFSIITAWAYSNDEWGIRVNGASIGAGSWGSSFSNGYSQCWIGRNTGDTENMHGWLAELGHYSQQLAPGDIEAIEEYLATKYDIAT